MEDALRAAEGASRLAAAMHDRKRELAAGVTRSRLLRKLGHAEEAPTLELRRSLHSLLEDPEVQSSLRSDRTLLREAAAELGAGSLGLLEQALEILGLDPMSSGLDKALSWLQRNQKGTELGRWLVNTAKEAKIAMSGQASRSGAAADYAGLLIAKVRENLSDPKVREWLAEQFASSVDRLLRQVLER